MRSSTSIPDGKNPPNASQLKKLGRLYDAELDARLDYENAIVLQQQIYGESAATASLLVEEQAALDRFTTQRDAAAATAADWQARLADLRAAFADTTARLLGSVATDVPALLLPVRLETRFEYDDTGATPQALRIRVFPDAIHVDSHQRALSVDETVWGRHFIALSAAAVSDAERLAAWRVLASRFGVRRASWIASVLGSEESLSRQRAPSTTS